MEINYKDFNTFEEILPPKFQFESTLVDEVRLELRALTSSVLKSAGAQPEKIVASPEQDPGIPEKDIGSKSDPHPSDKKKKPKGLKQKSTSSEIVRGRKSSAKSSEKEPNAKSPHFGENARRNLHHEESKSPAMAQKEEPNKPGAD